MSLKDYLEGLEIGEGKAKLSKEEIKGIIAESGKVVNNEVDKVKTDYETTIQENAKMIEDLKTKLENAPSSEELENLKNTIAEFESNEEKRKAQEKANKEEEMLNANILAEFGDRKFTSDYAKKGLMTDIKAELNKEENKGKGIKEIIEVLTKDRSDIFENPNKMIDMVEMGNVNTNITKADFDKMTYAQRVEFKDNNPDLFREYNK